MCNQIAPILGHNSCQNLPHMCEPDSHNLLVSKELLQVGDLEECSDCHDGNGDEAKYDDAHLNLAIGFLEALLADNEVCEVLANPIDLFNNLQSLQFNWFQMLLLDDVFVVNCLGT